ncbi:biopolymer transporter ExbD [Polaribacter undariae]|uniref:Biopolymer transporter ExbD n=1 Tax=Polaribacter sejongensis TaxID=985043 RepID=A0AAJ1QX37_9FLAO|nr:biopolymer transporter ExbD [Polaribacter undariae]MDN3619687.1 biopolymer transporter ExbD [Polaribacter undariae]UWD31454.1 biopolymer transporter ExbD [Polaribacter undariae]
MSRKETPEINTGSMADIAFLLLIFFLVTTTMSVDAGISKKIPQKQENPTDIDINERNILEVNINKKNELFVDGKTIELKELKQIAINFIDNGGGLDINKNSCNWCNGSKNPSSSDHPTKAIITIKTDRLTTYETYISTLDILNSAYTHLRNKLSVKLYNQNYASLLNAYKNSNNSDKNIQEKIKLIREKYPLLVSDIEFDN